MIEVSNFVSMEQIIQLGCKMVLMKERVWSILNSSEHAPEAEDGDKYAKFMVRRDRALVTIVLC